jgi:hypothetical protein
MKNIFMDLSSLKIRKDGRRDWVGSVGLEIQFNFEDKKGKIKIVDCSRGKVEVTYLGKSYWIGTDKLQKGMISNIICNRSDFLYKRGDHVRKYIVTDCLKKKRDNSDKIDKIYVLLCTVCNNIHNKLAYHIEKYGCPYCSGRKIDSKLSSLAVTHPHLTHFFPGGHEEASKYSKGSSDKVRLVCPICGNQVEVAVSNLVGRGYLSCEACGDGFSYGEKFVCSVLRQANIQYTSQKKLSGAKYRYDIFIKDRKMIIEVHGLQHYENNNFYAHSLSKVEKNDQEKKMFAQNHLGQDKEKAINDYIVIDARKSTLDYLKYSVIKELGKYIDLSGVNYESCAIEASSSKMKEACRIKKNTPSLFKKEIAKMIGVSAQTTRTYLQRGHELGLCTYLADEESKRSTERRCGRGLSNAKKLKVYDLHSNSCDVHTFQSQKELVDRSVEIFGRKVCAKTIKQVIEGKSKIENYVILNA